MTETNIERRIVIGMIVSTEYLQAIHDLYNVRFLKSSMAKRLASWCREYFTKYNKAPNRDIEGIYFEKLKKGNMPKEVAEEIEDDILPGLSEEYASEHQFNYQYLLDQTLLYFKERKIEAHLEDVQGLLSTGEIDEAEEKALNFKTTIRLFDEDIDLSNEEQVKKEMENAFNQELQQVITYPGALGNMWNNQLVRGGFVALMGREKMGKTFRLLDMAIRAIRCKSHVAFFQAGDMTKSQQLKRIGVYLAKRSNDPKYCGTVFIPTLDCVRNQIDDCNRKEREGDVSPFTEYSTPDEYLKEITFDDLKKEVMKLGDGYSPCRNCSRYIIPTVWYKTVLIKNPLTATTAIESVSKFMASYKRQFKISTHPTKTLTVQKIKAILNSWEHKDGFVPDVIVIDYADILAPGSGTNEFRHQQDQIWAELRGLAQEKHCLVLTATQANAASYKQNRLYMTNFSEDKRKLAHTTAMYGLNQDKDGKEKEMGLLRINEIVVREGDFSNDNEVFVMQCLPIGRPFLGSFTRKEK